MAVMLAGGMTIAAPGMVPMVHAANDELFVSAQEIGNFAGIQVIEIVVDDPNRSETNESEGRPNVEINSDDVLMVQGTDGIWYGYVVNQLALDNYADFNSIFVSDLGSSITNTDAEAIYANATTFLDGAKNANLHAVLNNAVDATDQWPFIQSYDISENSQVTITYGSGSQAESVVLTYDYDDNKDLVLDRSLYPENSYVLATLDDSLLNLSPTADDIWAFYLNGTVEYIIDTSLNPIQTAVDFTAIGFEEGPLELVGAGSVVTLRDTGITDILNENTDAVILLKTSDTDDNVFVNWDSNERGNIQISGTGDASLEYESAHSIVVDSFNGFIEFTNLVSEWISGIEIGLVLTDEDKNLNSAVDEDLLILEGEVPYIVLGNPITLDEFENGYITGNGTGNVVFGDITASKVVDLTVDNNVTELILNATWPTVNGESYGSHIDTPTIFPYINFDLTNFNGTSGTYYLGNSTQFDTDGDAISIPGLTVLNNATHANLVFDVDVDSAFGNVTAAAYIDILFFGQLGGIATDGEIEDNVERVNDAIYRFELEETDDNTAKFEGSLEYIMINQLNVFDTNTYDDIETADEDLVIIVNDDLDDEDSVRVNYRDIDSTGSNETISVQEEANTHTGAISLDKDSYSSGNTITVTLEDSDLNTDSDTIEIYTTNSLNGWVGNSDVWLVQMLIDDVPFNGSCDADLSLDGVNFSFIETARESGIFTGSLKLPLEYCEDSSVVASTNGLDLEFEYQDYSDASGEPNETSTSVSVRSNTGSVTLDRTVYPVPVGLNQFALHAPIAPGDPTHLEPIPVNIVIRVNDPDANISASGEDTLSTNVLKLEIARGSLKQLITINSTTLLEISPDSGIFEVDVEIDQDVFPGLGNSGIEQGDIIQVQYTDPADASGDPNTVTDSGTFDLRNGVLQTDKSVYIIGSDAIITLIEPDLDLDSESAETLSLDLVNWDSDAGDINLSTPVFDAEPFGLRETGDSTGIFQVVIEIPREIDGDKLERGEQIELEYTDWGPAGANFVGDDDEDINLDIFTSNFGATVELDQKVYTWTDKVYITIVAPDHNFDDNKIDEIGVDADAEITISTRGDDIDQYKLVETGTDTGIFTGEVILTGFSGHDADGNGSTTDTSGITSADKSGPTNGFLAAGNDDGLTVSFEFSDGETALGSSLIRWNIGEVQWLEASYPATGTGVVRVIDPDLNLNPESVDTFDVNVWSDTASGGISLAVTETNEATGIFEGTVFFTVTDASSGSRLRVSEGDTITAEYEDNTLPDPYSTADELDITATATIGTIVPPLERAPAGNLRAVDAFGNSLNTVQVDQQIQVQADLSNTQDRNQEFAYLLQVQDENGVTVSLSWITGELTPGQQFSPAVSWIPTTIGVYDATVFVWASVDNPTALSPPVSTTITVNS